MNYSGSLFLFITFFFSICAHAQKTGLLDLYWSAKYNRALLVSENKFSLSGKITNNFLLKQLCTAEFLGSRKVKNTSLYLYLSRFGYTQYSHTSCYAGIAKKLTQNLNANAGIGIERCRIPETVYSDINIAAEAGISFKMNEALDVSFSVFELTGKGSETINPGKTILMIRYNASQGVSMTAGALKMSNTSIPFWLAQCSYHTFNFYTAIGCSSGPSKFFLGFGWNQKSIRCFIGMNYIPGTGTSPESSITWISH